MDPRQLFFTQFMQAWNDFSNRLMQEPNHFTTSQYGFWEDYLKLWQGMTPSFQDKRFQNHSWQENHYFNFIKHSYLLLSQHLEQLIQKLTEKGNVKTAQKLRFYAKQWLDALAPSNFSYTNPEVLQKIFETKGENILLGFKQFIHDFEKIQLNTKLTDLHSFTVGENIACTKGSVVFQNDLMQLIMYQPTTETVFEHPILMIPPWINKYYILDLQSENSFVQWLVNQGFIVFMISWVNPNASLRHATFSDYIQKGPLAALACIKQITQKNKINLLGYCVGGTLLGCLLAYLAKKDNQDIISATFLTTLFDFSEPGELGNFIDEEQISALEQYMEKRGFLDGNIMAAVFNSLRANDLIWSAYIQQYLKGEKPKPFDLLFWNADATNIPEKLHRFYLRHFYLNNELIVPGKISVDDTAIDLNNITIPSYFLAAEEDHIVPWQSAYRSQTFLKGPVRFVLTSSGHVAGVINPPHRQKYGFWSLNHKKFKKPKTFLSHATFHEGSWWNDWVDWMKDHAGERKSPPQLEAKYILEPAPGSYVKVNLLDIAVEELPI